jgi:hypothetical protein
MTTTATAAAVDTAGAADDADGRAAVFAAERGEGLTLREIGKRHGVSHERVRQVLEGAGIPAGRRGGAAFQRRQELADRVSAWLVAHGPVPSAAVREEFGLTAQRLSELVLEHGVPREFLMAGSGRSGSGVPEEELVAGVARVWAAVLREDPSAAGLSVGLYDRYRGPGDPSPAAVTSRMRWSDVCARAGVPAGGAGRPSYSRKWSDDDLLRWAGRWAVAAVADGVPATFNGYDVWRRSQPGAPSGALLRTRLRGSGFNAWHEMVATGRTMLGDADHGDADTPTGTAG